MKAGQFNIHDYLEKLYETAGDGQLPNEEGMIIPEENQKSYQWLKKEYQRAQTEVKVEINMGGAKFEPDYDLQTDLKSVKDFKPGMFGEVKTTDTKGSEEDKKNPKSLDTKKEQPHFQKGEGEKPAEEKDEKSETKPETKDIKDKVSEKPTSDTPGAEVKKMDLKTKKTEGSEKEDKGEEKEDKDDKKEKDDNKK
jgi:hypothetical protein